MVIYSLYCLICDLSLSDFPNTKPLEAFFRQLLSLIAELAGLALAHGNARNHVECQLGKECVHIQNIVVPAARLRQQPHCHPDGVINDWHHALQVGDRECWRCDGPKALPTFPLGKQQINHVAVVQIAKHGGNLCVKMERLIDKIMENAELPQKY
jgi:hypothetical protein